MAIVSQEITVDVGELPHQEQRDACEGEEKKRPLPKGLEEAMDAVVVERDGEGEKEGEGEEIKELGEMEAGLVARPVAHYYPIIHHQEHQESCSNCYVRPGNKQHRFHVTDWREHEERHLFHPTEGQGHGGRGPVVPLLCVGRLPGLVQLRRHQRARAKRHPDDVGLAEKHRADPEEGGGLVAAVEGHEVGEEDEESRPRVCVVEKIEKVEDRKGGQGQSRQDPARCRLRLKENNKCKKRRDGELINDRDLTIPFPCGAVCR